MFSWEISLVAHLMGAVGIIWMLFMLYFLAALTAFSIPPDDDTCAPKYIVHFSIGIMYNTENCYGEVPEWSKGAHC